MLLRIEINKTRIYFNLFSNKEKKWRDLLVFLLNDSISYMFYVFMLIFYYHYYLIFLQCNVGTVENKSSRQKDTKGPKTK